MKKTLKNKGETLKLTTLGFTLIELLAVIVILAVIALISVPLIMNIIDSSKKGSAEASAYGYINGIYDTSGGAQEYVMGNFNNARASSGFTTLPNQKYYDKYTTSTGLKGDATNADGTKVV